MHDAGIQSLSIDYQCSLQSAMKALTLWSHGCEGADGRTDPPRRFSDPREKRHERAADPLAATDNGPQ